MEKIDKGIGVLEKALSMVEKYKIVTILKGCFIVLIIAGLIGFINNPLWIFEKIEELKEKAHTEKMAETNINSDIINTEIENLRLLTGADRVLLLQYHNTKQNLSGLPFVYLTATAEAIAADVAPVASGYEAVKTSLYPFVSYIRANEYWCGDAEELKNRDKALAYRMIGNDVQHLAMLHLEGKMPLGVIVLTFTKGIDDKHNCSEIEHLIRKAGLKIGLLIGGKK